MPHFQMYSFHTGYPWLDSLAPEGIPVPSSILISGPSATGKPFVGLALAAAWLRQGGKVILIPMHYGYRRLFERVLSEQFGLDPEGYRGSTMFIDFDPGLDPEGEIEERPERGEVRANLVNPKLFRRALAAASGAVGGAGARTLIFAPALNLLLFSPTYGELMFLALLELLRNDRKRTYLFAASSSILLKKIIVLERASDHLLLMERMTGERTPRLRIARLRGASFTGDTVPVPLSPELFEDLKNEAVASRRLLIPAVGRI